MRSENHNDFKSCFITHFLEPLTSQLNYLMNLMGFDDPSFKLNEAQQKQFEEFMANNPHSPKYKKYLVGDTGDIDFANALSIYKNNYYGNLHNSSEQLELARLFHDKLAEFAKRLEAFEPAVNTAGQPLDELSKHFDRLEDLKNRVFKAIFLENPGRIEELSKEIKGFFNVATALTHTGKQSQWKFFATATPCDNNSFKTPDDQAVRTCEV